MFWRSILVLVAELLSMNVGYVCKLHMIDVDLWLNMVVIAARCQEKRMT